MVTPPFHHFTPPTIEIGGGGDLACLRGNMQQKLNASHWYSLHLIHNNKTYFYYCLRVGSSCRLIIVKKVSDFTVPSRDVTNQIFLCQEYFTIFISGAVLSPQGWVPFLLRCSLRKAAAGQLPAAPGQLPAAPTRLHHTPQPALHPHPIRPRPVNALKQPAPLA